jgi:HEAT repeat protein
MSTPPVAPRRLAALALVLSALAGGCTASKEEPEGEPYVPPPAPEEDTVGFFLTRLDNELKAWMNLKLGAETPAELRMLRGLELELTQATTKRKEDLLTELESRSPTNRGVAAIALGFTNDDAVVGPLLNALADPDPLVENNALVGLGVLASPSTPLGRICHILASDTDPWTRNNAAYAMAAVIAAGGRDACTVPTCRDALIDAEPGVRVQAATILGMLGDRSSVTALGDLLFDEQSLVARAAAAALGAIARAELQELGTVGRNLVDAAVRRPDLSDAFLVELRRLSTIDYGDDLERWTEWAYRLP